MIKYIVLLNFAFKWRLVKETRAIALVQAGTQGNIFLKTQNRHFLSFLSVITNLYQRNISFVKTIHIMYVFLKDLIGKTNCYWHLRFSSVCIRGVWKKGPGKKAPEKIAPTPGKLPSGICPPGKLPPENWPPGKLPPKKLFY